MGRTAARLSAHLADHSVADVGFSLATGRTRFEHRAVVIGSSVDDFRHGLDAIARGHSDDRVAVGVARPVDGGSRTGGTGRYAGRRIR